MTVDVLCYASFPGGMDLLLTSLARQTVLPDRLVLVDAHYDRRKAQVSEVRLPFPVEHMAPAGSPWPRSAPARYLNTGLRACRSDLVVVVPEWTWLPSGVLAAHVAAGRPAHTAVLDVLCPPARLSPYLPAPSNPGPVSGLSGPSEDPWVGGRRYVEDVISGRLDWAMLTAFAESPGPGTRLDRDHGGHGTHSVVSAPRLDLLAVDGWDERYDGGRPGLEHEELSDRLKDQCGSGVERCEGPASYRISPHSLFPPEDVVRATSANLELLQWGRRHGAPRTISGVRLLPSMP